MIVPDRVGYVLAARAWQVGWHPYPPGVERLTGQPGSGQARLWAATRNVVWPPGVKLRAECRPSQWWYTTHHTTSTIPDPRCECGIYGAADPAGAIRWCGRRADVVLGVVALWGTVLSGPQGWRAEYAYPWALVTSGPPDLATAPWWQEWRARTDPLVHDLARTYGVPVLEEWPELTPPSVLEEVSLAND